GTVTEEFAVNIIKLGADDYLLKDRLMRLPEAIKSALKQKETEKEKREAEKKNKFKADLLNTIGQAVLATDSNGIINFWNKAAEEIYGWTSEEAIGKDVDKLLRPKKTSEQVSASMELLSNGNNWSGEIKVQRKNNKSFPIYVTDAPVYDQYNKMCGVISVSTDITERKKTDKDLKDLNQQLNNLSSHLQSVREEERTKIAKELHDELGQQLSGLKMEIFLLIKKLSTIDEQMHEKGNDIINHIDETINSVRRILSSLRPGILDDLGLIAALEWHSSEVEKLSGIKIDFTANTKELNLPNIFSTAIFRIYQEAVTYIISDACADKVKASLRMNGHNVVLEIKDDRPTGDSGIKNIKKTPGLLGIRQRVFLLGGQCDLGNEVEKATKIKITIPL
ncbi:MAG TPA: PAS domain S-box protein, partial [Ginsengibacter sp.]